MKNKITLLILIALFPHLFNAQTNTNVATSSGNIGKCAVWGYPYTLYNSSGAYQGISNGVTVTVDQNRNIGGVVLAGTGALNFSGSNGITFSGSGTEITCRWDINSSGSYSVVNNNNNSTANSPVNLGVFFTAPYSGDYGWIRDTTSSSAWSASVSGAYLNGNITVMRDSDNAGSSLFYQDQPGNCGSLPGTTNTAALWNNSFLISMTAGTTLSYRAGTAYQNTPGCNNTTMNFTLGKANVVFIN
ncbi:hypothetical protein [uncultured Chryseobacterium sp.]|uniref:hypothetical protein n=1 Tax=uncultured Chryseobacterium sp. TaxID=259322 RepID=UPI0025CE79E2|nr:hypothetical protein [uncultured Chryseobacterium sp.]